MKIIYKIILITALVIAGGIIFQSGMVIAMGVDDETVANYTLQDDMLIAKQAFVEKSEVIQGAAEALIEETGLSVLSVRGGDPVVQTDKGFVPISQTIYTQTAAIIEEVMSEYEAGCTVTNIAVTDEAVIFYFGYYGDGVYGILFEKEISNTEEYSTIELMENWKVFYRFPGFMI